MYPDPDSQAEQFDEALERRQAGEDPPADDPAIRQLVEFASRLERDLPEDTPDPMFRRNLKQELLGAHAPDLEPVDLASERWHRRLIASPWRVSAAAAAVLVVGLVAVMMGMNPLSDDDGTTDTASFEAFDQEDDTRARDSSSDFTDTGDENQTWFAGAFPPLDGEHVVLPPFLEQLLTRDQASEPEVDLNGADEMIAESEMPDSAPVLYLSAPSDAQTMLTTLRSTLGVPGEIRPGDDDEPFQVVNQEQEPVITWDPNAAFFEFRGDLLEEPFTIETEETSEPAEVATGFLERIGFDLVTIDYEHRVNEIEDGNEVEFRPSGFPEMGLDLSLGGRIVVGESGEILQAELFWLSLIERRNATLRDPDEILRDIEGGQGYMPPMPDSSDDDPMQMDVEDAKLTHVLTRMEEGRFVLQPAMALSGGYDDDHASETPLVAQYVVPAAQNGD